MRSKIAVVVTLTLVLGTLATPSMLYSEDLKDGGAFFEERLMRVRPGWPSDGVVIGNELIPFPGLSERFSQYDDTDVQYAEFISGTLTGGLIASAGVVLLVVTPFVGTPLDLENPDWPSAIPSLLTSIGGLASLVAGYLIAENAERHIYEAVDSYNRHQLIEYFY